MIGKELAHVREEKKIQVLTEPFLHAMEGSGGAQEQVVLVEYLRGVSSGSLEILRVENLPTDWMSEPQKSGFD